MRRSWSSALFILFFATNLVVTGAGADPVVRTVAPTEIDDPLPNPYMGWGLWAGPRYFDGTPFTIDYNTASFGDDAPLFSWVLVDWMWADLEPEEGRYYWKDLDTVLNYWGSRGKQIDLRVWVTDDPGWNKTPGNEVCPEWLWKAGAPYREYMAQGMFKKREPDYANPAYATAYLPRVRKFLAALAERYDKPESPIVMWGAMGYGQFGEWHTRGSKYPWPDTETKRRVLSQIVQMYADIYKVKQLRVAFMLDTDSKEWKTLDDLLYRQAIDVAISKGFSVARHGFMTLNYFDWKMSERFWRQIPMYAEANWSYTDVKNHGTHGTLPEHMEVYRRWHSNYAHYYMDAAGYKRAMREDRSHFEEGLKSGGLGYRLVLTSAGWSEEVPAGHLFVLNQKWVNRNVGRLYVRHPLKLYLTDSGGNVRFSQADGAFDQTGWVAGETYPIIGVYYLPKDLAPGQYDVRVAMVDQNGEPRINLAILGADSQKRYWLGTVRIVAP